MNRNDREIELICGQLVDGSRGTRSLQVSLAEFQKFYTCFLHKTKETPFVSLVNLDTLVKAQFSNISPQHFDIISPKLLLESDFDFVINKKWYGASQSPESFPHFFLEELKLNFWKLLPTFIISFTLSFLVNSQLLYDLVITLIIQSGTVFLSIYLIFTVSQSSSLYKDTSLFKKGVLQKYYWDDRNVTLLGILTIALTFFFSGFVYFLSTLENQIMIHWAISLSRGIKAVGVATIITLLFDTFLTVVNYYLERNRDVIERDMASDIMDDDYKNYCLKQKQLKDIHRN